MFGPTLIGLLGYVSGPKDHLFDGLRSPHKDVEASMIVCWIKLELKIAGVDVSVSFLSLKGCSSSGTNRADLPSCKLAAGIELYSFYEKRIGYSD